MHRRWTSLLGTAVAVAALAAGCSGGPPKASGPPAPAPGGPTTGDQFGVSPDPGTSAGASASPGALPSPGILTSPTQGKPGGVEVAGVLGEDGIGPYLVGTAQSTLTNQGRLAGVTATSGCPNWATAKGTGVYAGLGLVFYQGRLDWVEVGAPGITARAGGRVGLTQAQLQAVYPGAALLTAALGAKAVAVRNVASGNELFFRFGTGGTVSVIQAGPIETLEFRFTDGEGC